MAIRHFAIGLAVLTASSPVLAEGITYDCDTAANHYSELVLPVTSDHFTVSGNVRMRAMAGSKDYVPLIDIQVSSSSSPGKSPDAFAGFRLSALPIDKKKSPTGASAIQALSWSMIGKDDEVLPSSLMTPPGTLQPFSLSYDGGAVSIVLGDEKKQIRLDISQPVVRVICSTGEFLITDLTIDERQ